MMKMFVRKSTIVLFAILLLQLFYFTNGYAYCVHRDTGAIEDPPGSDRWVEECCDGRPSHWASSAIPVPVYIYDQTPNDLVADIENAVQAWNNIESSFFSMEIAGYIDKKDPIPGAIVIGFDTALCTDGGDPCLYGATSCPAVSVDGSRDGFQIQSCTIFADAETWNNPGRPNSLWVMTHELGHALGIMHPDVTPHGPGGQGCGPQFLEATMECCDRQAQNADVGNLELDDMAAATSLYPKWKYTVKVVDRSNNPIQGAAVWMHGTCFPHDGADRYEGGMVFGDIPSCLVGDLATSETYYSDLTYVTKADGTTGDFRVMHDQFCFTVVATGYADSTGCQTLPAPGNYITTVTMSMPPVCNANGPYVAECQGTTTLLTLDGTGSTDPDPGDTLSYAWTTDCTGGSFDNPNSPMPILSVNSSSGSLICNGSLTVTDSAGASDSCSSTIIVSDTLPPSITCPPDTTIECDMSPDPANTGSLLATDICDADTTITFSDIVSPGSCSDEFTITRSWTASDDSGNSSSCVQTIDVVDTTAPVILCNSPATIIPPNAPISFTATATDNCDDDATVQITGFTCSYTTKKSKLINKQESCIVSISEDEITISDSGGVDSQIKWNVNATDCSGNTSTHECSIEVVKSTK